MAAIGSYVVKAEKELPDEDRGKFLSVEFWDDKIREYFEYIYNGYVHALIEGDKGETSRNYYAEDVELTRKMVCERILYNVKTDNGIMLVVGQRPEDEEAVRFMIFILSAVYYNLYFNYNRFPVSYRINRYGEYVYRANYPFDKLEWNEVVCKENRLLSERFHKMVRKVLMPMLDMRFIEYVLDEVSSHGVVYLEDFKKESISEESRLRVVSRLAAF